MKLTFIKNLLDKLTNLIKTCLLFAFVLLGISLAAYLFVGLANWTLPNPQVFTGAMVGSIFTFFLVSLGFQKKWITLDSEKEDAED